jgi:F0F1-type ATP synthase assembly protein I
MMLTHYHHKNDAPFQNLSSLAYGEALKVISNLRVEIKID